jgi:hypothetical protein
MPVPRRDFIKVFGISLGSLLLTRCQIPGLSTPEYTCYAPMRLTDTATPVMTVQLSARRRLRLCWLRFGELARKTTEWYATPGNGGSDSSLTAGMLKDHQAALDELVAADEIAEIVAGLIQEAYAAAVHHIWRSNAPMTCYIVAAPEYTPASANDLVAQAAALDQVAEGTPIPAETLAKIRSALEHDLAFYALSDAEVTALYERLRAEYADSGGGIPDFAEVELTLTPEAKAAAEFLIGVLTEK